MPDLNEDFFARPTLTVCRELLGCVIRRDDVLLRIVETEGYLHGDSASHAFRGRTHRNAPMWGAPGQLYVYLCYGIHVMLNFVTEQPGTPAAVLIRGVEVVAGHEQVMARRGGRLDCIGPGKVGQALALDKKWSGRPIWEALRLSRDLTPVRVETGPRVGIDYAQPEHVEAPWRFRARDGWLD